MFTETTVDDIPVLWSSAPGPLTICLSFRVGRADETLSTSGLSHFVEHLVLSTVDPRLQSNGSVGVGITNFFASGYEAELVDFIAQVTHSLMNLPLDRLEIERQVLLTEEASRPASFLDNLSSLRFGARTYGLRGFRELGLRRVTADEVVDWSRRRFVAEAARLWITGQPPEGLTLENLPHGSAIDPPDVTIDASLPLPCYAENVAGGCAYSFLATRSTAIGMGLSILLERSTKELRHQRGLAYALTSTYEPFTAEIAHLALAADPLPERTEEAAIELVRMFEEISQHGPTNEELKTQVDATRRHFEDPMSVPQTLDARTVRALLGATTQTDEELHEEASATTPEDVCQGFAEVRDSLLVQVPGGVDLSSRIPRLVPKQSPPVEGQTFKPQALRGRRQVRVTVGDEGVSLEREDSEFVRILFDEVVAAVESEEGKIGLVNADGDSIEVKPSAFSRSLEMRSEIMQRLPDHLVVPFRREARKRSIVEEIASRDLLRRWAVDSELEVLPDQLDETEEPLLLAEASRGMSSGLMVVTDQRIMFVLASGDRTVTVEDIPRSDLVRIEAESNRLTVGSNRGKSIVFKDVVPQERVKEAAAHLGQVVAESSQSRYPTWPELRPILFAVISVLYALAVGRVFGSLIMGGTAILDIWTSGRLAKGLQSHWSWVYLLTLVIAGIGVALPFFL